jgi:hypothetical protein
MELSVCELALTVVLGIIIFMLLKNILQNKKKEGFRRLRNRRFKNKNNPYACAAECQTEGNRPVVITQPGSYPTEECVSLCTD